MTALIIIIVLIAFPVSFLVAKTVEVKKGRSIANREFINAKIDKFSEPESVKNLSILPLVDSESISNNLQTENGVSYLVSADSKQLLLDLGFNRAKKHPSPLLHNMEVLKKSFNDINYIVFSHAHLDHLGGMKEQKTKTFSISKSKVDTPKIPVFAPVELKPSELNPQLDNITVSKNPIRIMPGVFTTGVIPRHLFLMGRTQEQALAIKLEGKGIVLILGCGHQTIQRVIERTKKLFNDRIYAVFGGLHFPLLKRDNISLLSVIQYIVGSDRPPWNGLNKKDVFDAIEFLKAENVQLTGLSPHDSSKWSINEFRKAFGEKYVDIKVGKEIVL